MSARKYIIIPEYRPLYAMALCYGPLHGPLSKPCPTPIDVIGKLLLQSGAEKLTIYEVKADPNNKNKMLPPVLLTLDNYRLPYETIAGMDPSETPAQTKIDKKPETKYEETSPTFKPSNETKEDESAQMIGDDKVSDESKVTDQPSEEKEEKTEAVTETTEDTKPLTAAEPIPAKFAETNNNTAINHTYMTREERRAARRRNAEASNNDAASNTSVTTAEN